MHTPLTMKPSASFDIPTSATAARAASAPQHNPCSPRQTYHKKVSNGNGQHGYFLGSNDEYSPTCVFAASFDSMAEQQQQQHFHQPQQSTAHLENRLSQISFDEVHMDAADYDHEIARTYTAPDDIEPPQVRRTTRPDETMSNASSRPSDPIARLLLSK